MLRVYSCIATQHDWGLIALACAVCFLTSFAAFQLFQRACATTGGTRLLWLVTTGVATGYGVWATHFIAMLAFSPGLPVSYDLTLTVISLLAAAIITGLGFAVSAQSRSGWTAAAGGAIFGVGVAVMHYTGMAAMQLPGQISWDAGLVAASILFGVGFGVVSLLLAARAEGISAMLSAAAFLTLSIVSLHFTGMGALEISPDPTVPLDALSLSPNALSLAIASAAAAVLGISLVAALAGSARERLIAQAEAELVRQTALREVELERTRRLARTAEQRLVTAIDAMSEGFAIYDEDDRLVMANQALLQLHEAVAETIVPGARFEDILRTLLDRKIIDLEGAEPEAWIAKQLRTRATGDSPETLVHFTDGRWMLRRERRTPDGEMVGIRSDITAIKQHEQELSEARQKAEAADRAKSEFVATISHEIRTPISGIIGFNQLMLMDELTPIQRERAEIVKESSAHLLQLVNDLLDLAKISSDSIALELEPFSLTELVNGTVHSLTPLAQAKQLTLAVRSALPPETVLIGDSGGIKQILINLIGNAIKFTARGSVTLAVSEKTPGFLFEITDTGGGIPDDKRDVIFERFAQLGGQSDRAQGAGLGLAITKRLIELMHGTIGVASQVGRGTVFSVWLPLQRLRAAGQDSAPVSRDGAKKSANELNVLVAEDHPFNQILITEILQSIGCRVSLAANGKEALDQIDASEFDLIIMDNHMPVMTGIEAIEFIRARTDWKRRIPIIAVTANAKRGTEKDYQALGVNEFIAKPFEVAHVVATVLRLGALGRKIRTDAVSAAA